MNAPHITQLRAELMATLADLRNRESPMEVDRARAVAQVAGVLVDTARVEVEYIKATDGIRSEFIEADPQKLVVEHRKQDANDPFGMTQ